MSSDKFEILKSVDAPDASQDARARALNLAMQAFDDEQNEKKSSSTQGLGDLARPISIATWIKGLFAMENRVPLTAALTGLVLLPIGYLLFQSTAMTPLSFDINGAISAPTSEVREQAIVESEDGSRQIIVIEDVQGGEPFFVGRDEVAPTPTPQPNVTSVQSQKVISGGAISQMDSMAISADEAPGNFSRLAVQNSGTIAPPMPTITGDQFAQFDDANLKTVVAEPVSTFSIDVDKASYAYVRNALNQGWLPQADAVRVEELINYFDYEYTRPASAEMPFSTDIEIVPSPWSDGKQLMRIGVQGFELAEGARPAANLVFLIDTSGSMNDQDKLPLLVQSFSLMLDGLHEDDTVSIVAYAGSAGTVLAPTQASDKRAILNALRGLSAGGSTAGAEGIELAYQLAQDSFKQDGVNQVILATDGDFNVGLSGTQELADYIADKRDDGVFLSVLGFGSGNLNDGVMQALAQNGDGAAYYIDTLREAQAVLVDDLSQTLVPIARDVKIQVEFNPAQVAEYRLIGYETRALNREDFNNDQVDAGEVGAGASVTALYELTPVGSDAILVDPLRYGEVTEGQERVEGVISDEFGFFKLRYKLPEETDSRLMELPITQDMVFSALSEASEDTRFAIAVAAFGQKLRGNSFVANVEYEDIRDLAASARGADAQGYRAEFLGLVDLAAALDSLN